MAVMTVLQEVVAMTVTAAMMMIARRTVTVTRSPSDRVAILVLSRKVATTLVHVLTSVVEQGAQDKHVQSMLTAVARARAEVCARQHLRRLCITVTLAAVLPANGIVSERDTHHMVATGASTMARRSARHVTTSLRVAVRHARLRLAGTLARNQAQAKENQRMRPKPQHQARAAHRSFAA